MQPFDLHEDGR